MMMFLVAALLAAAYAAVYAVRCFRLGRILAGAGAILSALLPVGAALALALWAVTT